MKNKLALGIGLILLSVCWKAGVQAQEHSFEAYGSSQISDDEGFITSTLQDWNENYSEKYPGRFTSGNFQYAPDKRFRLFSFELKFDDDPDYRAYRTLIYFEDQGNSFIGKTFYGKIESIQFLTEQDRSLYLIKHSSHGYKDKTSRRSCLAVSILKIENGQLSVLELFEEDDAAIRSYILREDFESFERCADSRMPEKVIMSLDPGTQVLNYSFPNYHRNNPLKSKRYWVEEGRLQWNGTHFEFLGRNIEMKEAGE